MNRKQITEARRKLLSDIDSARIAAATKVLRTSCNVVPIEFKDDSFCSSTPKMFAINCPYHGTNGSFCTTCDHMITFRKTEKIVYCMKDKDLQKQTDILEGRAPKPAKKKPKKTE